MISRSCDKCSKELEEYSPCITIGTLHVLNPQGEEYDMPCHIDLCWDCANDALAWLKTVRREGAGE